MVERRLDSIRVAILATDGFEQIELEGPRTALDNAGAKTTLIATGKALAHGGKLRFERDFPPLGHQLAD